MIRADGWTLVYVIRQSQSPLRQLYLLLERQDSAADQPGSPGLCSYVFNDTRGRLALGYKTAQQLYDHKGEALLARVIWSGSGPAGMSSPLNPHGLAPKIDWAGMQNAKAAPALRDLPTRAQNRRVTLRRL